MTVTRYVDSDPGVGSDAHDGTDATSAHAWLTLQHAVTTLLSAPVVEDTVINLAGTVAGPKTYDAPAFSGVTCVGGTTVTVQPTIWFEANYHMGLDPFSSSGTLPTLAIDGSKPCAMGGQIVVDQGSAGIIFKGIAFATTPPSLDLNPGVSLDDARRIEFHYCRMADSPVGLSLYSGSSIVVENSFVRA